MLADLIPEMVAVVVAQGPSQSAMEAPKRFVPEDWDFATHQESVARTTRHAGF